MGRGLFIKATSQLFIDPPKPIINITGSPGTKKVYRQFLCHEPVHKGYASSTNDLRTLEFPQFVTDGKLSGHD